jgi:Spy/CpxP family protein refolding chaperone
MTNHRNWIALLLAGAFTAGAYTSAAQPQNTPPAAPKTAAPAPQATPPGCPGQLGLGVLGNLGNEQRQKVEALRSKKTQELAPLHQQLAQRRAELRALWAADAPSREQILQKQAEIAGLRTKLQTASVDFRLAVLALLTPEQRATLRSSRATSAGRGMQHGCMMQDGARPGGMMRGHGTQPGGMGHGAMMGQGPMDCPALFDPYECAEGMCSE